ncbi:TBC1 domain family member 5 homolog A isoform X1 [Sesamum indicum]|uniref:TBC1 domain family member 5 homolog A isoform X1 n=1 Tax=Sesamum indicum TaxID=4182 RepID=A0A6I9TAR1_SESIN|nr:TBC1 domain family member 5 homolog A isoform X1 [Sesamum indicum]
MSPVPMETTMPETASCSVGSRRFGDLRGVQWRVDLDILPSSPSASIDELRRVTANSRRRYAALRKQLLVDPHVPKDGGSSPDLVMDNPLSQNPDSMWGRFFRNAELEKMVDQDLTRLYPERGSYFQTSGCQGMLRRILLLWCLRHQEYGYRQGMHELLAPLLYVLHVDVERLSEVRKDYEDHFADKFDGFSYHENDLTYKFEFKKFSEYVGDGSEFEETSVKASSLTELDPVIQTIVLLSDAYGAEGELGIVLSEKFMEHDAYAMFDALMSGAGGVVAMAEFFSPSPYGSSHTGLTPVIEASAAMYHLLSVVDSSLHTHLVELGVEPQYFSLRWLRVLFGREFSLEDLLVIWDEIFARDNKKFNKASDSDAESNSGVLDSPRGAFISAFAVSMILMLRSSLLATENATACLQRLLSFPDDIDLGMLVEKAKSLQALAADAKNSNSLLLHPGLYEGRKLVLSRVHSLPRDSTSPRTPLGVEPESYWEEKWRVLHKEEEHKQGAVEEQGSNIRKRWSERVKLRLSRTESDPSPSKKNQRTQVSKPSSRRSLLEDLARQLGSDDDKENTGCNDVEHRDKVEANGNDVTDKKFSNIPSCVASEENSPNFSDPSSPVHRNGDQGNQSESSSVASNSCIDENEAELGGTNPERPVLRVSDIPDGLASRCTNDDSMGKSASGMKERRSLSGKFNWILKLGRDATEGTSKRPGASKGAKIGNDESGQNNVPDSSSANGCDNSSWTSKGETVDQNLIVSLRNLGHTMLENIQVLESAFEQDRGQMGPQEENGLVGKGQVTAMSALKELRKISNLLSEM